MKLNDQKDYIKFGEQTAKTLYGGAAPYRIENFMKELCKDLKVHCDAQQIKKILDNVTLIHKEKEKEDQTKWTPGSITQLYTIMLEIMRGTNMSHESLQSAVTI